MEITQRENPPFRVYLPEAHPDIAGLRSTGTRSSHRTILYFDLCSRRQLSMLRFSVHFVSGWPVAGEVVAECVF